MWTVLPKNVNFGQLGNYVTHCTAYISTTRYNFASRQWSSAAAAAAAAAAATTANGH